VKVKVTRDKKTAESSPLTMHSRMCTVTRPYAACSNRRYHYVLPGGDGLCRWDNQRMLSSLTSQLEIKTSLRLGAVLKDCQFINRTVNSQFLTQLWMSRHETSQLTSVASEGLTASTSPASTSNKNSYGLYKMETQSTNNGTNKGSSFQHSWRHRRLETKRWLPLKSINRNLTWLVIEQAWHTKFAVIG